jgi:hypothetical protein
MGICNHFVSGTVPYNLLLFERELLTWRPFVRGQPCRSCLPWPVQGENTKDRLLKELLAFWLLLYLHPLHVSLTLGWDLC